MEDRQKVNLNQASVSGKSGNLDDNLIKDIIAPLKAKSKNELLGRESMDRTSKRSGMQSARSNQSKRSQRSKRSRSSKKRHFSEEADQDTVNIRGPHSKIGFSQSANGTVKINISGPSNKE